MGAEPGLLSEALAELASMPVDAFDVTEMVHLACDRACEVLSSDGAIVLLTLDGVGLLPAGAAGAVGDIDALLAHEGCPCRVAMRRGEVVAFVEELGHDEFPDYAGLAVEAGIRRVLSVPLCHRGEVLGTLSMLRLSAVDYSDDEVVAGKRLADVVATNIVREQTLQAARATGAQLEHALRARVVVEQAKGMVAAELHVSIDEALECIRRFARRQHLRLTDVAADIVGRTLPIALLRYP